LRNVKISHKVHGKLKNVLFFEHSSGLYATIYHIDAVLITLIDGPSTYSGYWLFLFRLFIWPHQKPKITYNWNTRITCIF
jgi:hypothetical protein